MPALAGAETIYLKDGQVIKAKITKDTPYSVQIMEKGFPKTFMKENIDRIEPDEGGADTSEGQGTLTPEKRELILRLMEANGARDNMVQIFNQIISQLPPAEQPKYREILKVDEIIEKLIPIYAKYYTTEDLKEIITFYKTPVGQKHIQNTPLVMQESLAATVKYFQEKNPKKDISQPPAKQ
jgi:hypothetical protein